MRPGKSRSIRGTTYSSKAEAARMLGVSRSLIDYYERRGQLDMVGLRPKIHDGGAKPIEVHGVPYASMAAAAEALNVTTAAVSKAARRGTLNSLGSKAVLE